MSHVILTDHCSELAEGPLWHPDHGRLYWVDIESGTLFSHDPEAGDTQIVHQGSKIGGFTIQEDGALLLFRERGAIDIFDGGITRPLIAEIPDEIDTRFNDVAADPAGRVFCGTMPTSDRLGRLYRLDQDASLRIVLEDVTCSNGIGWTPDRKRMYFTDSGLRTIFSFDYDKASGEITHREAFFTLQGEGVPDGMTVDADGNIWTAIWDGSCVIQIDASGREMRRIPLPAKKITCPTFGGDKYDQLYVTTAGGNEEGALPGAGELLRVDVGVRGVPEFRSKVRV